MMLKERISINTKICHGQACIKGTRIPVHQIIRMLANGDQIKELLEDYPSLKKKTFMRVWNMPRPWPKSK